MRFALLGHLQLTKVDTRPDASDDLHFNPTRLVAGMEVSDDQILLARGAVYPVSAQRRKEEMDSP